MPLRHLEQPFLAQASSMVRLAKTRCQNDGKSHIGFAQVSYNIRDQVSRARNHRKVDLCVDFLDSRKTLIVKDLFFFGAYRHDLAIEISGREVFEDRATN